MKTGHFMNAGPLMVLCAALAASGISIRAEDTADQAAARAALEQKLYQLDHAEAPPPDTNSAAGMAQPPESFTNVTNAVSATAVPVTKVSAAVAPAKAAPPSTAPADGNFAQKIPAADASAQAAALAALNQKMNELNTPAASPPPVANSATTTAVTPMVAPAHEPSASATPVTEAPTAEAPVAVAPAMAPAAMAPVSTAPAVLAPAPRVSPAAVAASVAVVPVATPAPVTLPAGTPPAAAPATPRLPSSSPRQMRPTNELVTMAGVIYKNVEVQKVMADAVVISYTPAHGDWAMAKVYFRDLLPEIRRQYEKP